MADTETWLWALGASVLVSLLSLVGILLLPFLDSRHRTRIFALMVSFAAGALLGDTFFHLIPEIFHLIEEDSHDHDHGDEHDHDHNVTMRNYMFHTKSLFTNANDSDHDHAHGEEEEEESHDHSGSVVPMLFFMVGFFAFYALETYLHHHHHHHHPGHHGPEEEARLVQSHHPTGYQAPAHNATATTTTTTSPHNSFVPPPAGSRSEPSHAPAYTFAGEARDSVESNGAGSRSDAVASLVEKPPLGILMVLTDALHNFVDGLAIGAAFVADLDTGLGTTLAIVAHEIPAEMGEMAVLLSSGYSRWQALLLNLASATTAILGAAIGVAIGENVEDAEIYILPIIAGGFVYIACVDLMPEILSRDRPSPVPHAQKIFAIWLAIAVMIGISYLE